MSNNQPDMSRFSADDPNLASYGDVDGNTVASPELGYGMERIDFLDTRTQSGVDSSVIPRMPTEDEDAALETLARNEVAAVSVDRTYYVTDQPSPYLSKRQARADVYQTRRRRSTITTVIVVLLVLAAIGAGGWFMWKFTRSSEPQQIVKYDTREIEHGEFLDSIDATALVQPIDERTVMPSVSGTVAESFVEEGKYVEEGAWLFRLDNPTITDAVVKAEAALSSFQAEANARNLALDEADATLAKAQEAYDKVEQDLKEAKGEDEEDKEEDSDSEDDKDKEKDEDKDKDKSKTTADPATIKLLEEEEKRAEDALKAAREAADKVRADAETANINLYNIQEAYDRALEQQQTLTIIAPISGVVNELNPSAVPSGTVTGSTRMCLVSDTSRYRVQIEIPKESADRVSIGQEARLAFPAIEDLNVTSSVASIDSNGEVLLATIILDEPDERITSGVAAEVSLVLNSIPDSLMVPLEAIRTDEDGSTHLDVLLDATRNIVTDVPITVVATNGTHAAIKAANIQRGNSVIVALDANKPADDEPAADEPTPEAAEPAADEPTPDEPAPAEE